MKNILSLALTVMFYVIFCTEIAFAGESCITSINVIQIASDATGNLTLYVYSKELPPPSTYLFASDNIEKVKAFHAQFLFAKASGKKVCFVYTPSPSYQWALNTVAVANEDGWPFQ